MKRMEYSEQFLKEQRQFLEDLLAFREPLEKLEERDKIGHVWDDKPEDFYLAIVTRQHVISILQRFLVQELSQRDVYDWAETFDVRESVGREPGYRQYIIDALAELSNDYDHGLAFTERRAQELIFELENAKFDPTDT